MTVLLGIGGNMDPAVWQRRFQALLPDRPIAVGRGEAADEAVRYAVTWYHAPGSLAGLPNLRAIFSLGAGVDHIMGDPDLPAVPICRVVDPNLTARMSEHVVLQCLLHLRRQPLYAAQQRARVWREERDQPAAGEVRVGLMGLGVLGRDAAAKLAAIGFDVAGWNRTARPADDILTFVGEAGLDAFLGRTDILVVLLPLTEGTRGLLARPLFERLARDGRLGAPILVNAGRGRLQVEADILACLEDGTLGAASLDVFETEPLPADSPLWSHPGVIVTPHAAAASDPNAIGRAIAAAIRGHEAGEGLPNVVDRAQGY